MADWINHFKEKEGRKGLLPWISVTIQMWILVGLAFIGVIGAIISLFNGGVFPAGLIMTAISAVAFCIGIKTDWARKVESASTPIKITGAVILGAGTLFILVSILSIVVYTVVSILIILFGLAVLALIIYIGLKVASNEEDSGTIIIRERSRMVGDFDRGYQDGLKAGRTAKAHGRSDTAIGELIGSMGAVVEEVVDETCNFAESEEYQEGFRKGVEDTW